MRKVDEWIDVGFADKHIIARSRVLLDQLIALRKEDEATLEEAMNGVPLRELERVAKAKNKRDKMKAGKAAAKTAAKRYCQIVKQQRLARLAKAENAKWADGNAFDEAAFKEAMSGVPLTNSSEEVQHIAKLREANNAAQWADGDDFDEAALREAMNGVPLTNSDVIALLHEETKQFDEEMVRMLRDETIRQRGTIVDEKAYAISLAITEARYFAIELFSGPTSSN